MNIVSSLHQRKCIFGHHQLFIRRNDENFYGGIVCRDHRFSGPQPRKTVAFFVQFNSESFQTGDGTGTVSGIHLSDTGRKNDSVYPSESCHIRANVFFNSIRFHFKNQLCPFVSCIDSGLNVATVAVFAGNS